MRKYIIKLLFWLLEDRTYQNIDDDKIRKWLAMQYKQTGFRDYYRKRGLQHLKVMGLGIEGKNYWIRVGQRLELLTLLDRVNSAYRNSEKVGKKKFLKKNK